MDKLGLRAARYLDEIANARYFHEQMLGLSYDKNVQVAAAEKGPAFL